MRKLLAGSAIALVLAMTPAYAEIPVSDATAVAVSTANSAREVAQLLQQVQQLRQLLTIQGIANAVLGEGAAGEWGMLLRELQQLNTEIGQTVAMVNGFPLSVQQQMMIFSLPGEGADVGAYLAKLKQIEALFSSHNSKTLALQSKLIRANAEYARETAQMRERMVGAEGQMEVQQLIGVQLANIGSQLVGVQETLSQGEMREAMKERREEVMKGERDKRFMDEIDHARQTLASGPKTLSASPIYWGR